MTEDIVDQSKENKIEDFVAVPSEHVKSLKDKLKELNIKNVEELAEDEVVKLATSIITDMQSILRNSGIVISHTIEVFESMAKRGRFPDELQQDSPLFKKRAGTEHLIHVLNQILPIFEDKSEDKSNDK